MLSIVSVVSGVVNVCGYGSGPVVVKYEKSAVPVGFTTLELIKVICGVVEYVLRERLCGASMQG